MQVEVAVIGAGAAGISAARRLRDHGRDVLLVEAMDRVGGRAHTVATTSMPLDLGCGWFHSAERNPLVQLAESQGRIVDRSAAAWRKQLRNLGFAAGEQEEAWAAYTSFERRLHDDPPPGDVAGKAVAADERWRGYLDVISGALNGAELDRVSAKDLLAYDDHASETNWRAPDGLGTVIGTAADAIRVTLGTPVRAVSSGGERMRVETDAGIIIADAVIVTASTTALARGDIRFDPQVDDHLHAAACLPLGRVDKLFVAISEPDAVPPETHLIGDPHRALTGSYYMRPFGHPVIECFFGGIAARAMEEAGDAGRLAFAREELGRLLGTKFARGLQPIAGSWWSREPTIGGAYSHALPGRADQRAALARPVDERLCFAGEACSPHDFSTAHGAWASGIEAARHVEAVLSPI